MSLTDLIDGFLNTAGGGIPEGETVKVHCEAPFPPLFVDGARSGLVAVASEGMPCMPSLDDTPSSTAGCSLTEGVFTCSASLTVVAGPEIPAWISSARIPSNRSRNTLLHRANPHWAQREPLNRGGITFSHPGNSHIRLAGFSVRLRFLAARGGGAGALDEDGVGAWRGLRLGALDGLSWTCDMRSMPGILKQRNTHRLCWYRRWRDWRRRVLGRDFQLDLAVQRAECQHAATSHTRFSLTEPSSVCVTLTFLSASWGRSSICARDTKPDPGTFSASVAGVSVAGEAFNPLVCGSEERSIPTSSGKTARIAPVRL